MVLAVSLLLLVLVVLGEVAGVREVGLETDLVGGILVEEEVMEKDLVEEEKGLTGVLEKGLIGVELEGGELGMAG